MANIKILIGVIVFIIIIITFSLLTVILSYQIKMLPLLHEQRHMKKAVGRIRDHHKGVAIPPPPKCVTKWQKEIKSAWRTRF